ncbi:protein MGARP isoform X2 [Eublepharis macularius]|uniref:Protein MGARP isoform X2 n=1 Tax=Eublepharis macularius TaxID=481883 RepID=A0AA97JZ29_EUBMA|nr:protein MGARP isoform X2 [Eublepharis macularius]
MPLCRVAWQTFAARLARAAPLLRGQVPFRQMSSGSVPGSSGENVIYYLCVVGATTAGGFYVYKTINSDKTRYNERIEDIQKRSTAEWKPKPWPPESLESDETETKEVTDANEEAKDAATEETEAVIAGDAQDLREELAESAESEKGEESPVEDANSGVPGGEQGAAANSAATQGTPDNVLNNEVLSSQEEIPEGTPALQTQERPDTSPMGKEATAAQTLQALEVSESNGNA